MTTSNRGLGSPAITMSLAVFLVSLVVLATATGVLQLPGAAQTAGPTLGPTGVAVVPTPTPLPTIGYPTPSPAPTFLTYVVKVGDTLSSIARQYATTARSVSWWNRGTYPNLDPESPDYRPNDIRPGWRLVILPGATVDDENPPSPSPAPPTPTPGPSDVPATPAPTGGPHPTSSPSIAPIVPANVISHGSRTSTDIALTLDMGGRLDPAVDIMSWLIAHQVHATIFPTGVAGSTTDTGKAVLALVKAHPELFDVGNHSWSHPDFRTLTAAQMVQQIQSTESAIAPLAGQSTKPWFRPPYGGYNDAVRYGVAAAGWRHLVMWDVDTIDWKPESQGGPTTADIVAKIQAKAQGGSIVLMHLGGYNTLDALPGILAAIQAKGLHPVTLGEMFGQ
jgi:peptidoglycan/xylan/chitin deacetylase (PgdA/CDA1 family)